MPHYPLPYPDAIGYRWGVFFFIGFWMGFVRGECPPVGESPYGMSAIV